MRPGFGLNVSPLITISGQSKRCIPTLVVTSRIGVSSVGDCLPHATESGFHADTESVLDTGLLLRAVTIQENCMFGMVASELNDRPQWTV